MAVVNSKVETLGPVESRRLLDNPDPQLIESSAIWHLSRALNMGRVVAFVGAGLPMAYGRISWRGLVEMLTEGAILRCKALLPSPTLEPQVKKLLQGLLDRVQTLRSEGAGPDQYPTLFQLAEQLDLEITKQRGSEAGGGRQGATMRVELAANVFDDRGQGKDLFRRAFIGTGMAEPGLSDVLDRLFLEDAKFDTTRSSLDQTGQERPLDRLFSFWTLDRLAEAARSRLSENDEVRPFVEALATGGRGNTASDRSALLAVHRFAAVCLLRLAVGSSPDFGALLDGVETVGAREEMSRHDAIPSVRDPLLILYQELGVKRFLTTNYDLDIEKLFRDVGFSQPPSGSDEHGGPGMTGPQRVDRLDPLGGRSRDLVLTPGDHGLLIDFATQDPPVRPQVVHLHGRATKMDGDEVVVTERDYQNLYQRDGVDRLPMDVARRIAFGGNPLLFVGLGLGEDDILRPLRQFMGQESRLGDRLAVAIMPGSKRATPRLLEQMTLLNRYGVYGIYYGTATLDGDTEPEKGEYWLARIFELADAVQAVVTSTDAGRGRAENAFKAVWDDAVRASLLKDGKLRLPTALEGIPLDDLAFNLNFEMGVLDACCAVLRCRSQLLQPSSAKAIELAIEGVKTSLQSMSLSARLRRLHAECLLWKKNWYSAPLPRVVAVNPLTRPEQTIRGPVPVGATVSDAALPHVAQAYSQLPVKNASLWFTDDFLLYGRHIVELPPLQGDPVVDHPDRFYADPPSRALDVLGGGLRDKADTLARHKGRRTFLLISRPGVGKGHVFTSMLGRSGLPRFLAASWGQSLDNVAPRARYARAAFYNLSFSHEVASVFDRITQVLEESWESVFPKGTADPNTVADIADIGREARFQSERLRNDRRERLANICLAYAKAAPVRAKALQENSPANRILIVVSNVGALYDEDGEPKNTGIGRMFEALLSPEFEAMPVDFVFFAASGAVPRIFRKSREATHGTVMGLGDAQVRVMLRVLPRPCTRAHQLTVLEQERVLDLVNCVDSLPTPHVQTLDPSVLTGIVICHVLRRAQANSLAAAFFPRVAVALTAHAIGRSNPVITVAGLKAGQQFLARHAATKRGDEEIEKRTLDELLKQVGCTGPYTGEPQRVAAAFREFARAVSKSRFTSTILFAAADEQIGPQAEGLLGGKGAKAVAFLDAARLKLMGVAAEERDATAMAIALASMERLHRERYPAPLAMSSTGLTILERLGPLSHRLLTEILWHVAVIGEPVEARVLAICPGIQHALANFETPSGRREVPGFTPNLHVALVQDGLRLLLHRCLIFKSGLHVNDAQQSARFSMHLTARRVIFKLLEASLEQSRALERFSLSLYIVQSSDLPRPTWEAHQRLRDLAYALSGYPHFSIQDVTAESARLWSRRLRAAYGVICSVYHVGTIGRFDEYGSQDASRRPYLGFFESHRLLVRWLFQQAIRLDAANRDIDPERPFYAEEIVWLVNEAGVLSLAQGRVDDASDLFGQALGLTRATLAPNDAALAARIGLNSALADIERGAAPVARQTLKAILAHQDEHKIIRGSALGLMGLADHLAGEFSSAENLYTEAIRLLLDVRSTRAASIFKRHLGDLYRARGKAYWVVADDHLRAAESLARQGAHDDVQHLVRLSRARLLIEESSVSSLFVALQELDAIQVYAQLVGLPRLLAEVATARSEAVLRQGEIRRATELAAEAVEISTLHDLRLIKTQALTALSQAFLLQGVSESAGLVRRRAEELAQRSAYASALKSVNGSANPGHP